ncbi:MAG: hypothetical protein Q8L23_15790 [Caulobacter sp.]|nr:hypothetical protein [Caulobacter sp.]
MTLSNPVPPAAARSAVRPAAGAHRPAFWRWAQLEERKLRAIAEGLTELLPEGQTVSYGTVFNWMLPWNDPRRLDPSDPQKAAIETLTAGAVTAADGWLAPAQQDGWAG